MSLQKNYPNEITSSALPSLVKQWSGQNILPVCWWPLLL